MWRPWNSYRRGNIKYHQYWNVEIKYKEKTHMFLNCCQFIFITVFVLSLRVFKGFFTFLFFKQEKMMLFTPSITSPVRDFCYLKFSSLRYRYLVWCCPRYSIKCSTQRWTLQQLHGYFSFIVSQKTTGSTLWWLGTQ